MVVNRKQPTVPQAVSRSASTQHVPTKRHPKPPPKQESASMIDSQASKTANGKASKTHAKKRHPKSWTDRLFLLALSLFTCYAFYACRPNPLFSTPLHSHGHTIDPNPLCRSLHGYRVHILEPYVIPTVKHTLSLTHDLAEPYLAATHQKLNPYVAPVTRSIATAKPYVIRAVRTSKAIWQNTLVPFYKGTIRHYYIRAVLPRYELYIQPRLAPLLARANKAYVYYISRPLHIRATQLQRALHRTYHTTIAPYVARVEPYVWKTYTTVSEFAVQATSAYKEHVHPRLISFWVFARPHLCTAWKHSKATGLKAAEIGAEKLTFAAREAGTYRRAYVDPHIHKIWEKVAEGTSTPAPSPPVAVEDSITSPLDAAEVVDTSSETTELTVGPTSVTASEQLESTPISATPVVVIEATTLANPAVPTPEEVAFDEEPTVAASSVTSSTAPAVTTTVVPEPAHTDAPAAVTIAEPEPASSIALSESTTPSPTPAAEASSSAMKSASSIASASIVGSAAEGEEEVDVDGWLAGLGLEDTPEPTENEATPTGTGAADAETSAPAPDPAQVAADRVKLTAEKRARIVDRHEKWFDDLDALIANETQRVVVELAALREAEVDRLHALVSGEGGDENAKKQDMIDVLQKEGEKLLKGLEGYLRKAASRSSTWKLPPPGQTAPTSSLQTFQALSSKEKDKWAKVLAKVEEKFTLEVTMFRAQVHRMFVEAREKEVQMVVESKTRVKDLAEVAQADLGLDYAWLDDVTYQDWQKYHDLMHHHDAYEQVIHSIQNGTSVPVLPEPLDDPLLPALDALDKELQDVITGFSVALGPIRSGAAKIFSVHSSESKEGKEEQEEGGFFVVRDGEVRKDDFSGVDLGGMGIKKDGAGVVGVKSDKSELDSEAEKKEEDEVKILPISPAPAPGAKEGEAMDGNSIFIGKDRVQVEQALGGVPVEPAALRHEEL